MPYAIAVLLALLSLIVISQPFLKAHLQSKANSPPDPAEEPDRSNRSLFDDIDRLKLDLDLGSVTPEEYERQMNALRHAAAANLRAQELPAQRKRDESKTSQEVNDALEERIRRHRRALLQQRETPHEEA